MLLYGHPHSRRKVYYKLAAWEGILAGCRVILGLGTAIVASG
jgi:hypothetical protein